MRLCPIVVVLLCAVIPACQLEGKTNSDPGKKDVTRRDLHRALREHQKLLIVTGTETPQLKGALQVFNQALNSGSRGIKSIVRTPHQVTQEQISSLPCLLIGTPSDNPWINKISGQLPFIYRDHQLEFDGQQYKADAHGFVLSHYPNPYNVKLPLSVISSENPNIVEAVLKGGTIDRYWGGWNYQIFQGSSRILLGNFSQKPEDRWDIDQKQQFSLPGTVLKSWENQPYRFHVYHDELDGEAVTNFRHGCQDMALKIQRFLKFPGSLPAIDYFLYPSSEIKGLMTGNTQQSHGYFDRKEVHTVLNDHNISRAPGRHNQLLLRLLLGEPQHPIMELGLSMYFTENWEGKGYGHWARVLIAGGNAPDLADLFTESRLSFISPLIRQAVSASLVSFLIDYWGKEAFLEHYRQWDPSAAELKMLNGKWHQWAGHPEAAQTVQNDLPFMRGFNFTHEGYSIYNGYGSDLSVKSLQRLQQLHTNAVAIVPYTGMRDPKRASPFHFSQSAGSEHDEGVTHAIENAKRLGMVTMLKPQVWVRGGWPGEVSMDDTEQWSQFFDHYYRWISHYALLAEMRQVDILCIGVEFTAATLQQQDRWRQLIAKIRKIYKGKLTYAANWGEEFENLDFWEDLDYIGLNCYYPISTRDEPSLSQLKQGFSKACARVEQVVEKYKKPLLVTEIGFRSVESPWKQPHEAAGAKKYNPHHQALAYQAVMEVLPQHEFVLGVFWWKWPTVLETELEQDRRFIPYNKPAEEVIGKYYRTMSLDQP